MTISSQLRKFFSLILEFLFEAMQLGTSDFAWTFESQSDQNLHLAHFGYLRIQSFFVRTTRTLIRLPECCSLFTVHVPVQSSWKGSKSFPRVKDVITKTCLYNFGPLKPYFLYSKTGVYKGIHYFSYFCSNT